MVKGDIFIINIDDSTCKYDEIYDPDIKVCYSKKNMPYNIWNYESLFKQEVFQPIFAGTEHKYMTKVSKNFQVSLIFNNSNKFN